MIYLSESALKYAVNICEELPNYKVGIALSRASLFLKKDGYNIMRIMQDTITDIEARFYININGNTLLVTAALFDLYLLLNLPEAMLLVF